MHIDMNFLKLKYEPNTKLRYMPDFIGKRKRGRPKGKKRIKSTLELAMVKKKGEKGRDQQMMTACYQTTLISDLPLVIMMGRWSCIVSLMSFMLCGEGVYAIP